MPEIRTHRRRTLTVNEIPEQAAALWRSVPTGGVVWLSGDLGGGKTTFVQAVARLAGAVGARSPTFALVHEYPCRDGLLIHVDCYRLRLPDEALALDFPDLCRRARMLFVEWPERAGHRAPTPQVHLKFSHTDNPEARLLEWIR